MCQGAVVMAPARLIRGDEAPGMGKGARGAYRARMRPLAPIAAILATLAACAADPVLAPRDCTPGQTSPCACPGASGVQVCDPDGVLGACACPDGGGAADVAVAQDRPAADVMTPEDRPAADVVTVRDVASSPDVVDAGVGRDVVQDAFVCEPRQTCGSTCVADYLTDPRNRGACFIRCPSEAAHSVPTCIGGRCAIGCEPGYVPCGVSRCSYALDPNYNCGACGGSCPSGQICERDARGGRCVPA